MSNREVRFWRAYLARVPGDGDRLSYLTAQVAAMVINTSMARKSGSEAIKASELDPWHDPWNEDKPSASSQMSALRASLEPEPDRE